MMSRTKSITNLLKDTVAIKSAVSISTSNREENNFEENQEEEYKPPNGDHRE